MSTATPKSPAPAAIELPPVAPPANTPHHNRLLEFFGRLAGEARAQALIEDVSLFVMDKLRAQGEALFPPAAVADGFVQSLEARVIALEQSALAKAGGSVLPVTSTP